MKALYIFLFQLFLLFLLNTFKNKTSTADEPVIMPQNKQKAICHTLTILVIVAAIVLVGFSSSYSSALALSLQQPFIHNHHKVLDKKQQGDDISGDRSSSRSSSSVSDSGGSSPETKSSDKSNNKGNSNNNNNIEGNNNQNTNDGGSSNTGPYSDLQSVEPAKSGEQRQQQEPGGNDAQTGTATPTLTPDTSCEQGSNCTDQQGLSDRDRSPPTTTRAPTEQEDTPFVLSLPFP